MEPFLDRILLELRKVSLIKVLGQLLVEALDEQLHVALLHTVQWWNAD